MPHLPLDTSKVSQLFSSWKQDSPTLADDSEESIQQYPPLVVVARDGFTQLRFLHQAHYSLAWVAKIYPDRKAICPKCGTDDADFFHVVWSGPQSQEYWKVVEDINLVWKFKVPHMPIKNGDRTM